jgi:hypothetical protein
MIVLQMEFASRHLCPYIHRAVASLAEKRSVHLGELVFFLDTPKIESWGNALRARLSVRTAVLEVYPDRLADFLRRRNAYSSSLIPQEMAA